jgi:hypothetical protein
MFYIKGKTYRKHTGLILKIFLPVVKTLQGNLRLK